MNDVKCRFLGHKILRIVDYGILNGKWHLAEVYPIPKAEDIYNVIYNVIHDLTFGFSKDSRLIPFDIVNSEKIFLELSDDILNAISQLNDIKYRIAIRLPLEIDIRNSKQKVLGGQPTCFVVDPPVNFDLYPYHPHLNAHNIENQAFIPTTLCYTNDVSSLGVNQHQIDNAFRQVMLWLLRHELWKTLIKNKSKPVWIGNEVLNLDKSYLVNQVSPYGQCICGKALPFKDCCLEKLYLSKYKKKITVFDINRLELYWQTHMNNENNFRKFLMSKFDTMF